jgi:hypothetical protein
MSNRTFRDLILYEKIYVIWIAASAGGACIGLDVCAG